jgi:hypothetical protein
MYAHRLTSAINSHQPLICSTSAGCKAVCLMSWLLAVLLCPGHQVGPDDLRSNALAGLLVQLSKRDAFNKLRTQQQLGYIVHMYGSNELGVQVGGESSCQHHHASIIISIIISIIMPASSSAAAASSSSSSSSSWCCHLLVDS